MDDETKLNQDSPAVPLPGNSQDNLKDPKDVPSQINARTKIVDILTRVETRQAFSDRLLEKELDQFNDADRGLSTEVINGVLRWQYRLDWYLEQLYVGEYINLIPDVKNNLRSSVYQLMFLDKIPPYAVLNEAVEIAKTKYNQKTANLVNAILRNYLRQEKKLQYIEMELDYIHRLAVSYSHPLWLIQRWIEQWGIDNTLALCKCNNTPPIVNVRINHLRANPETFYKTLQENNIAYETHPDFPEFLRIPDFSEFRKLDLLNKGWAAVQDVSTGLPVRLLNPHPGEHILDMCAAPGGKSGYIGEKMRNQGTLLALDKHQNRARLLEENLTRLGVENATVIAVDAVQWETDQKFDKILVDAPCTGFGVLCKRVDLRWKRSEQDIENMHRLQLQLLEVAARVLQQQGVIVYSTCTIEPQENEKVIEKFLNTHPEFSSDNLKNEIPGHYLWTHESIRTFPHRHHMDGSFAVRLRHRPL